MREPKAISRRDLVAGTATFGASALILGGAAALGSQVQADTAYATENAEAAGEVPDGVQYGFLVDLSKCVGCENCVAACREANHLSDETSNRRTVHTFMDENAMNVYVSTACNHCADPNCLRVCPAGAIEKGAAGIVSVNKDRCIGCKYCFQACPYGVPSYNEVAMDKCDCCLSAGVAPGDTPYCVRACKFDALKFGPLDELRAEAEAHGGNPVPVGEPCAPSCLLVGEGR